MGEIASDNNLVFPNLVAAHQYTYDSSGNLITDTFVDFNGNTYRQTLTWSSGNLTNQSIWVKQ